MKTLLLHTLQKRNQWRGNKKTIELTGRLALDFGIDQQMKSRDAIKTSITEEGGEHYRDETSLLLTKTV